MASNKPKNIEKQPMKAKAFSSDYKSKDPFCSIQPALLNNIDIYKYVKHIWLINPFYGKSLKSAAYEMHLGGEIHYWDEDNTEQKIELKKDSIFTIRKNSIVFVTTEEQFYLPDYIAARFNLVIEQVHRGMLLGTGPLVNPGYVGHLVIPIHNLTNNDYNIAIGAPIISVEFTKISPISQWKPSDEDNKYYNKRATEYETDMPYIVNPSPYAIDANFEKYLGRARGNSPSIKSSFSGFMEQYEKRLSTLEHDTNTKSSEIDQQISEKFQNIQNDNETKIGIIEKESTRSFHLSIATIIGIVVACLGAIYPLYTLHQDTKLFIQNSSVEIKSHQEQLRQRIKKQEVKIEKLKLELDAMKAQHPEIFDRKVSTKTSTLDDGQQTRERKSYEAVFTDMRNNRGR